MPEAEDVITDVARHATIFARDLWRRHRKDQPAPTRLALRDVSQRLDLLIAAVFAKSFSLRAAQPPAPPTFLTKVFRRKDGPRHAVALPATDGDSIWLPPVLASFEGIEAMDWYRVMALQQAMRASRKSADFLAGLDTECQRAVFLLLEANAADAQIVQLLPGMRASLDAVRQTALRMRPPLDRFPLAGRPLEVFARSLLSGDYSALPPRVALEQARAFEQAPAATLLYKDLWTGDLLPLPAVSRQAMEDGNRPDPASASPRSAQLPRRPDVREPTEDEDDEKQGAWMIQTSQPHEQAEDPVGMQRPTDRDESTAAEEFADALSELPEARLVSTPGRAKEVLLSDDIPVSRASIDAPRAWDSAGARLLYPEWDCRIGAYREPGAVVRLLAPQEGPQAWVDSTLRAHQSMLHAVRRRFEMLRAQRTRLRKQIDGEEIDLEAYIDSHADYRAGLPRSQRLYQTCRPARRDMSIVLLIDISGSTDGWISANRRVIDVEREALLLVSIALQGLQAPYAVMGFSGDGPQAVTVRTIKSFDEAYGDAVARRIAALEPEHYTRAGAAIRHATAALLHQPAAHRLLLLLSDGKPNDIDVYEGRYGVEDMRQAVTEARLQGINPFCLTIDRQAANYLPGVFGAHHYALLPKPELLPTVLLEWMKRLVSA
ncbi:nitric oxide reductase activation protein NorD [Noviherbaspirillum sp. ST9]|uniref:nitric oxide reductase activation protein NorD n=1 Tax=Noviherbaspirillum sp. ST9 TaxID=3401606 RepID=UPI003B58A576